MAQEKKSSEKKAHMLRQFRRAMAIGLPFIGVQIILSVLLFSQAHSRMAFIMIGFLLVEVSVLMLVNKVQPNERRYLALRNEANHFLSLVRDLNTSAIRMYRTDNPEHRNEFERVQADMIRSVHRMGAVAGKTDEDLAREESEQQVQMA